MDIDSIINQNFTKISLPYLNLAKEKHNCKKCEIFTHYNHNPIQSEGNAENPIFMFIGEAPGDDELTQNRPFIGRAGQRIREELRKYPHTFTKENTVISNTVACRPLNNMFPSGKDGRKLVGICVSSWLMKEINILKPKVIVTLGSQALHFVRSDRGITSNRGTWKFLPEFRAWSLATYHPSYVLRCQNTEQIHIPKEFEKDIQIIAETWQDIVENDPNMQMTEEEWSKERAFYRAAAKGLLKPEPIMEYND